MVLLRDIKGQDNAVRYLRGSLSAGRVASSYLFFGPEGVGRALTAKAFLMELICSDKTSAEACGVCPSCRRIRALDHPDLNWIKPEKNRKIKIEEVRRAREALSLKPYEAPVNVCVIEDAHMMTVEASNALLKILEEPPAQSMLILISSKKEMLLPTVLSRCSEVRFRSLRTDEARNMIMRESGTDRDTAEFLACFSQGSPGKALEMIEEGLLDEKRELAGIMGKIAKEDNASCMNWNTDDRNSLLEDLELLTMFFRDIALGKEGLEEMALDRGLGSTDMYGYYRGYSLEKIYDIVGKLTRLRRALAGNVNPKLVAQVLPSALK